MGGTGTVNFVGPPTVGGTCATIAVPLTSITQNSSVYWTLNFSSASITATIQPGGLICPNDGSQNMSTFIDELDGIRCTDVLYANALAVQFPRVPIAGGIVNTVNGPAAQRAAARVRPGSTMQAAAAAAAGAAIVAGQHRVSAGPRPELDQEHAQLGRQHRHGGNRRALHVLRQLRQLIAASGT